VLDQRIDDDLVALHDIEDTFGHARLEEELRIRIDADGVRSEGLSTNVLPHAAAITNIQRGTTIGN